MTPPGSLPHQRRRFLHRRGRGGAPPSGRRACACVAAAPQSPLL